ncbi:MAG: flagellar basal body-associated FliL family protein [Hyphomicrobiales bacterium]|nr:flagellar basal body-associated FliL family protein [Hyphomicrobiales bacterium]MCP5373611.1 flagellar basal body-associated FliL family protein [Hyphomicrobiales bacterium]
MADDIEEVEEGGGPEDGEGEGGSPAKGGKKKLILVIVAVLVLVVGGLAGSYFMGFLDPVMAMLGSPPKSEAGEGATAEAGMAPGETVFYDLPELLVNLNTGQRKSTFLKIRVSLELDSNKDIPGIERKLPRIMDNFQVYLRELRVEDLKGSAGIYRLREELLTRVAAAVAPAKVNDVLFKEMLVQ